MALQGERVESWFKGAAMTMLRSIDVVGNAYEPPSTRGFERTRPIHPSHVLIVCSAHVAPVTSCAQHQSKTTSTCGPYASFIALLAGFDCGISSRF